jgi:hypothetical protein
MSSRWIVMVALLATGSTVSAQSLAEIAAKEKARRERVRREGTEAKTFSDRDLPRGREGGRDTTSSTSEPEEPGPDSRSERALTLERKVRVDPPQAEGPSEMEKLKAKSALWRSRWRQAKDQVEKLEKELAELEEEASHIAQIAQVGPETGPRPRTRAEYVIYRLYTVRKELQGAKQRLADVEAGARQAGVASGQLY